jgi:hypothetical protein
MPIHHSRRGNVSCSGHLTPDTKVNVLTSVRYSSTYNSIVSQDLISTQAGCLLLSSMRRIPFEVDPYTVNRIN